MLKDITIGQYIYGSSPIHRMDPMLKLIFVIAYVVLLFSASTTAGIVGAVAFSLIIYKISGIPIKLIAKSLKPIVPVVVFTAVINMFFIPGDPLITIWKLTISRQGLFYAVILSFRITCLISASSLLTYTTSPIQLTDAIERLLSPLKKLKMPVHELAMMMSIALRFIPSLIEETDKIMSAQKSRGASLDSGKLREKVKALVPVLVPLFVSAFRRADELALAMECRCYRGGEGRTRLHESHFSSVDAFGTAVLVLMFGYVIATNCLFEAVI